MRGLCIQSRQIVVSSSAGVNQGDRYLRLDRYRRIIIHDLASAPSSSCVHHDAVLDPSPTVVPRLVWFMGRSAEIDFLKQSCSRVSFTLIAHHIALCSDIQQCHVAILVSLQSPFVPDLTRRQPRCTHSLFLFFPAQESATEIGSDGGTDNHHFHHGQRYRTIGEIDPRSG